MYHIWRGLSPPIASAYPAQKNPAVWPCILAGALALLSVALIIETALKKEPGEEKKTIDWKSPGMIHVYIMLGIVVGFVVLMTIVGMLLALLIMNDPCDRISDGLPQQGHADRAGLFRH